MADTNYPAAYDAQAEQENEIEYTECYVDEIISVREFDGVKKWLVMWENYSLGESVY